MAAVFPIRTDQPWTFNGVTYEYDATEDRWFVISTNKTDFVDDSLETLTRDLSDQSDRFDEELETRNTLLDLAADKNNQQDAAIAELDQRLDAVAEAAGALAFSGRFNYVAEKSEALCEAGYAQCLLAANGDSELVRQCSLAVEACRDGVDEPYDDATFTSKHTNVMDAIEEFILSGKDLDNNVFDWINLVEEGDFLEFYEEDDGDTALYEVLEVPQVFNTQRSIRVKFLRETESGDGKFNLQKEYNIRVFKTSQGLDLSESDNRYVLKPYVVYFADTPGDITPVHESGNLRNGELWFDTSSLELFVWNNNSWVATSPPPSQDIVIQGVIGDVDNLIAGQAEQAQRVNSLVSDLLLENNIYYGDEAPTGDITGTLRNGDLWVDSDDLTLKFYSQGAWVNPDRQSGGDYLQTSGGEMTGKLNLNRPRTDAAGNNLVIHGRIGGVEGVLLKDYQRKNADSSDDFVEYYGGIYADNHITNKKYVDDKAANYLPLTGGTVNTQFTVANNGVEKFQVTNSNVDNFNLGRFLQGFVVKAAGQPITGNNSFAAYPDYTYYAGRIQNDNDLVNKKYVDDKLSSNDTFLYKAHNNLTAEDFEDSAYDGRFSASSNIITNNNSFWFFSDIDQNGKLLNLHNHVSSEDMKILIQIGYQEGTYLTDPNVNRDGMKVVYSGYVTQITRMQKGSIGNKVNTPGWELFLELGNGTSGIPADTIKVGGIYQIKFGGLL